MTKTARELVASLQSRLTILAEELGDAEATDELRGALEAFDAQLRELSGSPGSGGPPPAAKVMETPQPPGALRRLTVPLPPGSRWSARTPFRASLWLAAFVGAVAAITSAQDGADSPRVAPAPDTATPTDASPGAAVATPADGQVDTVAGEQDPTPPAPRVVSAPAARRAPAATPTAAKSTAATAPTTDSATAQIDHHTRGEQLLLEFKPLLAIQQLELALHDDPRRADTYFALGVAHHQLRRTKRAADAFAKLLALDPNHAEAARARAYVEKYHDKKTDR